MPVDERLGEILMGAHEGDPVALEERGIAVECPESLALEHELGDPVNQVLDGDRDFRAQFERRHAVSVYRPNQEMVKHQSKFSKPTPNLLG